MELLLNKFYSDLYGNRHERSDSPEQSRTSLSRRVRNTIGSLDRSDFILDLGSGPQIVTHQILRDRPNEHPNIITLDIAKIPRGKLLARKKAYGHIRGSGNQLPFGNNSFALVFSNMALDFMGTVAIDEVDRVLMPGGRLEVNLHHPSLIPGDLDLLLTLRHLGRRERDTYNYWKFLRDNEILNENPDVISRRFTDCGFILRNIYLAEDACDKWWEVSLVKSLDMKGGE